MELMWNLLMYAFVFNDVTFKIRLNLEYTVRLEIRQCQSQVRFARLVAVTEGRTGQRFYIGGWVVMDEEDGRCRLMKGWVVIRPPRLHPFA